MEFKSSFPVEGAKTPRLRAFAPTPGEKAGRREGGAFSRIPQQTNFELNELIQLDAGLLAPGVGAKARRRGVLAPSTANEL